MKEQTPPFIVSVSIPFGDTLNTNGRIYPKELVKEIVNKINEKSYPIVTAEPQDAQVDLCDVIGWTDTVKYDETQNRIDLTCRINTQELAELVRIRVATAVPNGTGTINSETKEVENYNLISFSLTGNSAFKAKPKNFVDKIEKLMNGDD
jgi:hypothetical protein